MRELISRKVDKGGAEIIFLTNGGMGVVALSGWRKTYGGGGVDTMEETMLKLTLL